MADTKKTAILDFQVDTKQTQADLERTEKNMIAIRNAQNEITKAYKAGLVSEEAYIKESIKLNGQLQKETQNRNTLTKVINAENGSLDQQRAILSRLVLERNRMDRSTKEGAKAFEELTKRIKETNDAIAEQEQKGGDFRRNVGNYANAIREAAGDFEFFGVSVNNVSASFGKFLTPAGAVLGTLGALTAAYASSALGGRDLAMATDTISFAMQQASANFAAFIQAVTGTTATGGPLQYLATGIVGIFGGKGAANQAKAYAQGQQILKQLEISKEFAAGYAKDSERIAENFRRIRDDEEKADQARLDATDRITTELNRSAQIRIAVLQRQLEIIPQYTVDLANNREAQLEIAKIETEIKDIQEEVNGKLTENLAARNAILKSMREEAEMMEYINKRTGRTGTTFGINTGTRPERELALDAEQQAADARFKIEQGFLGDMAEINKRYRYDQMALDKQQLEWNKQVQQERLDFAAYTSGQVAAIFDQESDAYKVIASVDALVNTYKGANIALGTYPPPFSYIAAAATVAAGLANVQRINGFDKGGYTGSGFGTPDSSGFKAAGIVHEHEYVVPKWQVQHPAYRPVINQLESGRLKGYADGGLVTSSVTGPVDQQLAVSNMMKNLPAPVVSVKEVTRAQNRVRVKESASKLRNT